MGIDGLHPVLRPYLTSIDLSTYAGKRVGCDASAWLHRGAVGCAADLAQDNKWWLERGVHPPYTEFCLKMLEMLRSKGVKPVVCIILMAGTDLEAIASSVPYSKFGLMSCQILYRLRLHTLLFMSSQYAK